MGRKWRILFDLLRRITRVTDEEESRTHWNSDRKSRTLRRFIHIILVFVVEKASPFINDGDACISTDLSKKYLFIYFGNDKNRTSTNGITMTGFNVRQQVFMGFRIFLQYF
ncbi:hypothetical protein CEXT_105281 [Caerostris extrusa]|uniref:Uncharacterized protein n=1 Tax=Caerostris extrusa TaxID=172846 RepID=A0AAV4TCD0_CAEEX|nr:hypothetical protein CEXT_105281 [Caerostris extrusa]